MRNPQALVTEFHRAFGLPIGDRPTAEVTSALTDLRLRLLRDEVQELAEAVAAGDVAGMAQEMADVVYVVYGYAITNGIPLDAVVAEVHRANMSKLGPDGRPVMREDGKVLKGPNYRLPDVVGVLEFGGNPQPCVGCHCCPARACEPGEPLGPGVCGDDCPCHPDFLEEVGEDA